MGANTNGSDSVPQARIAYPVIVGSESAPAIAASISQVVAIGSPGDFWAIQLDAFAKTGPNIMAIMANAYGEIAGTKIATSNIGVDKYTEPNNICSELKRCAIGVPIKRPIANIR